MHNGLQKLNARLYNDNRRGSEKIVIRLSRQLPRPRRHYSKASLLNFLFIAKVVVWTHFIGYVNPPKLRNCTLIGFCIPYHAVRRHIVTQVGYICNPGMTLRMCCWAYLCRVQLNEQHPFHITNRIGTIFCP